MAVFCFLSGLGGVYTELIFKQKAQVSLRRINYCPMKEFGVYQQNMASGNAHMIGENQPIWARVWAHAISVPHLNWRPRFDWFVSIYKLIGRLYARLFRTLRNILLTLLVMHWMAIDSGKRQIDRLNVPGSIPYYGKPFSCYLIKGKHWLSMIRETQDGGKMQIQFLWF